MADDVPITAGSGTNIAADERTINSTTVKVQRVGELGGTACLTGQSSAPTTTAATLLAARETRKYVDFLNNSTQTVYIGPATVTATTGFPLQPGAYKRFHATILYQMIIGAGLTATGYVAYDETYDA